MENKDKLIEHIDNLIDKLSSKSPLSLTDILTAALVTGDFDCLYNKEITDKTHAIQLAENLKSTLLSGQANIQILQSGIPGSFISNKLIVKTPTNKPIDIYTDFYSISLPPEYGYTFQGKRSVVEILTKLPIEVLIPLLQNTVNNINVVVPSSDKSVLYYTEPLQTAESYEDLLGFIDEFNEGIFRFNNDFIFVYLDTATEDIQCFALNTQYQSISKQDDVANILNYYINL